MLSELERFTRWVRSRSWGTSTWKDYGSDLRLFVRTVGDLPVEQVTAQDIDRFVNLQIEHGLKPTTINRRLAAIVSLYTFLSDENDELVCPVIPRRHYLREPQRLPRPAGEDNLRKFFSAIEGQTSLSQ